MKRWAGEKVKSWKLSMLPGGNCLADVVFEDGRELRYRNASIERAYSDDDRLHPTALMLHANPEQAITPTMVLLLADTGNPEVTPMASERPTCETCPYWEEQDKHQGLCRRHAPRSVIDGELPENEEYQQFPIYPITLDYEWCGSHPDFPAWLAERIVKVAPDFVVPEDWQHLQGRAPTALDGLIGDRDRLPVAEITEGALRNLPYCGTVTTKAILAWLAERKEGKEA